MQNEEDTWDVSSWRSKLSWRDKMAPTKGKVTLAEQQVTISQKMGQDVWEGTVNTVEVTGQVGWR